MKETILYQLFTEICHLIGEDPSAAASTSRKRELVRCRSIYCFLAKELTFFQLTKIAKAINTDDHSMVLHNHKAAKDRIRSNDNYFCSALNMVYENSKVLARIKKECRRSFFTLADLEAAFEAGKSGHDKAMWFRHKIGVELKANKTVVI